MSDYREYRTEMERGIIDSIIDARIRMDITQAEVARRARKSVHFVRSVERGLNSPSIQNLEPVLNALNLTLKVEKK